MQSVQGGDDMIVCAYCERDGLLTREHLFLEFLARRSPGYGTYIDHSRPSTPLRAVPVIRDVCAKCNNERLGKLDAYATRLTEKFFVFLAGEPFHVKLECDSDRLLRWLLKLLYNDARATSGGAIEIYRDLRPFILGGEPNLPFSIHLLAGIIAPAKLSAGRDDLDYPEHHGFSDIFLQPPLRDWVVLSRGIFLNSYFFYVLGWRKGIPRPTRRRTLAKLAEIHALVELPRPVCSVEITKAFADTKALMYGTFAGGFALEPGKGVSAFHPPLKRPRGAR